MGIGGNRKDVIRCLLFSLVIFSSLIISVGSVGAIGVDLDCTSQPDGTYCGACQQSGCLLVPNGRSDTLDYLDSGTKTCISQICSSSTCSYLSVCSDFDIFDGYPDLIGVSVSGCTASCDQNSDCPPYSYVDGTCHYNGFCNSDSCKCDFDSSQICLPDGNVCNGNVVEYRDYSCTANGCDYVVSESHNCNDGNVCNGAETCSAGSCVSGTPLVCDDGAFCNGVETCDSALGCLPGIAPACDDKVDCTEDSCDEEEDSCTHSPDDAFCNNGLFCDGTETCNAILGCQDGTEIDCSGNNLDSFGVCDYDPDNIPITLDIFLGFTSTCDEAENTCTEYNKWDDLTHTCSQKCGAECDENLDCTDKCIGDTLYNGGVCSLSPICSCSWTQTDCNKLDCSTGRQCVVKEGEMSEIGDDYSCVSNGLTSCGIIGKNQCSDVWICDKQCAVQKCGGSEYICYNNEWVSEIPITEICDDKIDNDCDGLIDCADSDCRDSTPPETSKNYGLPFFDGDGVHYINSLTPISLTATDPEGPSTECSSGLDRIYYRTCLDANCYENQRDVAPCSCVGVAWKEYTGSPVEFNILEDSEHCVEFKSIDVAGNEEEVQSQCVYVDNLAPATEKVVGEVKTKWHPNAEPDDYETSYFYPEQTAHCWEDSVNGIECWKVTLDTPINITCADDSEPHPVGFERLCFKMGWDGKDVTSDYCKYEGYSVKDGYCCGTADITNFKFKEESEHNLEYYCEDKLGNRKYDDEKFKVFGRMYPIDLGKKWNLISVPFDPLNKAPEAVFSEVEENIDSVWSYDAEMNQWKVYRPGEEDTNNLDEIKAGLGYWVMALDPDSFNVGGSLFAPGNILPSTVKVVKGWNLIGHYDVDPREVYCSLLSLVDTQQGFPRWSSLWGYSNPSQAFIPLDFLSESTYPGKGYWMEIDVNESYSPSSGCYQNT